MRQRMICVARLSALVMALLLMGTGAWAQNNFPTPGGSRANGVVFMCLDVSGNAVPATAAGTCLGSGGGGGGTTNLTGINGVAPSVNNGTMDAGTLRTVEASNSPLITAINQGVGVFAQAFPSSGIAIACNDGSNVTVACGTTTNPLVVLAPQGTICALTTAGCLSDLAWPLTGQGSMNSKLSEIALLGATPPPCIAGTAPTTQPLVASGALTATQCDRNGNVYTTGSWQGATGAAPPANVVYSGGNGSGATGGFLRGNIVCDQHAIYDASDNGSKTIVAGVASRKIYVCGYILGTGATATNLSLSSGTGTDCVTTSVNITPAYQLLANSQTGGNASPWNGLITLANADNLCVKASAGNAHQAEVWFAIL